MRPEAAQLARWRAEPWLFVRQVLQAMPDAWQDECLHALVESGFKRFALKACKGPGKSTLLAWAMWWFITCFPNAKIVACSITADNLATGLWAELSKWQRNSRLLMAAFQWTNDRIYERQHPETWFMVARAFPKTASPEKQADTLAGVHADFLMFVLDESGGMPRAVMAAAEAGLANANKEAGRVALLLQAGNPTNLDGPLYDACTRERAFWWVKEITGDPDAPDRATRVDLQWAREQIAKYPGGRDHPWVMVNVLGKFPPGQSNALIAVDDASAASRRFITLAEYCEEAKVVGVDVARFGDDETVISPRQGRVAFAQKVFRNINIMETAGQVAMFVQKFKPDAIFIDATGGYGAGVVDRLLELKYPVIGVEFAGRPLERGFANRRAEMWWQMAEWIKRGCIPDDNQLVGELPSPTYKYRSDGSLLLEAKEDMKKRGLASPNRADALALTFAAPVAPKALRSLQQRGLANQPQQDWDYNPLGREE